MQYFPMEHNMAGLTLGKYHYWDDYEDDNVKRFHFMSGNDGEEHHIDFSPYHKPTEAEINAVRIFVNNTGRVPDRFDNNGNNFSTYKERVDIFELLKRICACGEVDCTEAYSHISGGY